MSIKGFMCMIAWDHELGHDQAGTIVYPSLKALKKDHEAWKECGIVEVKVSRFSVVSPGKRFGKLGKSRGAT